MERPDVPADATRQLELMKVVPFDKEPNARSFGAVFGLLSLPIFAVIFYLLYSLVARNRYRIFGKYDECFVPDAEMRARVME